MEYPVHAMNLFRHFCNECAIASIISLMEKKCESVGIECLVEKSRDDSSEIVVATSVSICVYGGHP